MYALKSDFLHDTYDLTDAMRPRRKTVLDRLAGQLAIGQIFGEQFLYEVHGPFIAPDPEPARRPLATRLTEALSGRLSDIGRQRHLRRAAHELSRLDDRMLKDIGITRLQIEAAAFGAPIRDRGR